MESLDETIKYSSILKLLYVEDNESARDATLAIFEEFFEDIVVAVDGQDALEKFDSHAIDLIITDINMPRLNGLDMIKKIRETNNSIPILVLSAHNESGFFIDSIKAGVDGYLLKPIDIEQFLGVLGKIIQKLKLSNEAQSNLHLLHQYQEVTDKSAIVSKTDLYGNITYVNDAFCEISEYSYSELIGKNHNIVRHPNNPSIIYEKLWDTIKNKKHIWQGIIRSISKNGKSFYTKSTIKPILNTDGEIIEYIAIKDDITNIMSQKKQLNDLVNSMDDAIVVVMKIEGFDDIEKFYGQTLSQKIEEKFAAKLLKLLPDKLQFQKIFILGDGEYALVENQKECIIPLENIENNLIMLQQKIDGTRLEMGDVDYNIAVIVSFAYGKDAYENARYGLRKLLKNKQDFILANNLIQKERDDAKHNLNTLKMIKKALENSKIITYFQPIIDNETKDILKYETLVRLINSDNEVLAPYCFLDIAKKGKYYSQITCVVLEHAFNALKKTDKMITINLSAIDIEKRLTQEKIFKLLQANSMHAHRVVFELLEDENIKNLPLVKLFITKVKKLGVRIAIDDFGAGYSNFERLLDYQPDILKIDGSLIKNIENDAYSLSVVETIVNFAKKQNIKTVGEFVENENIYNILKKIGVDYSQGYFFGKPDVLKD